MVGYYAQIPPDVGPIDYTYKGLFGGFPGAYSSSPYYEGILEYNDIEDRNLWEYEILASPDLVEWESWTNVVLQAPQIVIQDPLSESAGRRYYRAVPH